MRLSEVAAGFLDDALAKAAEAGRAEARIVHPDGGVLHVEVRKRGDRVLLSTGQWRGCLLLEEADRDEPGWSLELIARALWLGRAPLRSVLVDLRWVAGAFGEMREERLRRLDLCSDFTGWAIRDEDWQACVRPPRSHRGESMPRFGIAVPTEDEQWDRRWDWARPGMKRDGREVAEHWGERYQDESHAVTGWTVCPGNEIMARVYDKTLELAIHRDEHKTEMERAIWTEHGWNGADRVTRVEFQVRGEAIRDFGIRDPGVAISKVDELWAYLTQRWCRLVLPGTATRLRRCEVDPRWAAVQSVVFEHKATKAERKRLRGFASASQGWGTMLSVLSLGGVLVDLRPAVEDEDQAAKDMIANWKGDAKAALASFVGVVTDAFRDEWVATLIEHVGDDEASLVRMIVQLNAAEARRAEHWKRVQEENERPLTATEQAAIEKARAERRRKHAYESWRVEHERQLADQKKKRDENVKRLQAEHEAKEKWNGRSDNEPS